MRPDISDAALESRVENTLRRLPDGRWAWKLDLDGITRARLDPDPARHVDLWPPVEGLRCPVLVIRGTRSDFLSAATCAEMAARQPLLRWTEVAAAGHYVHDDNLAPYLAALRDFLGRHRDRP